MPIYTVLYAEDVPVYGTAIIEADNDDDAIRQARALHQDGSVAFDDIAWRDSVCARIVQIERDDNGELIADGLPLDEYHLRHGEADRRLCDAAAEMLQALREWRCCDCDPPAAQRKGYYEHARALRDAAIAKAEGRATPRLSEHGRGS